MRLNSKELSKAVRYALYAGAATAVGLTAAPVFAQSDAAGSEKLETIVVTGSRIRRADIETSQPVFVIDRNEMQKTGFQSVADVLMSMTSAGAPAFSRSSVLTANESAGGTYVDLRDLGPERTLILINGKRLGLNGEGLQDLGMIPTSAVERIEVLKDGASATYGSDAIAGVINVITRKNFEGAEFNSFNGQYDQDDGEKQSYDFTIGARGERTSLSLSVQYAKEDPIWAKDRWFSAETYAPFPGAGYSPLTQWGSITNWAGRPGQWTLNPGSDPNDPASYVPLTADRYSNSNEQMHLQSGLERKSAYVNGSIEIADWISFRSDLLYNERESLVQVAGYPLQSGTTYRGVLLGPLSIDSYYNPLGNQHGYETPQAVNFYRRGWEVPRTTRTNVKTYRFTGGFEGAFDLGDKQFYWDVNYLYNQNDTLRAGNGDYNLDNLSRALGPSFLNADGQVQCGTASAPISITQCTPFNPLAPYGTVGIGGADSQAVRDYIYFESHATGRTKSISYNGNISGTIFTLPAGDVGLAAGYEYRRESGGWVPDELAQAGASSSLASGPTDGQYTVKEIYAELSVPLLNDLPFARSLELNVAGRYSDYDTFGDTVNMMYGIKWKPIDDLLVRGSWSEGFRAPTISDLFGGLSQSFPNPFRDPCASSARGNAACSGQIAGIPGVPNPADYVQRGAGGIPCSSQTAGCQSGYPFIGGANPDLTPETSKSKTLGLVYSPSYVEGLDITLDWYKIKVDNLITSDTPNSIMIDCYNRGIASRCGSIVRDPVTGTVTNMSYGGKNLGWQEVEGYDLGVRYRLPETSIGRFAFNWETTYYDHWTHNADPLNPDNAPDQYTGWSSQFRYKSNLNVDWDLGNFGATWTVRHYSGQKETCAFEEICNDFDFYAPYYPDGEYVRDLGSNTFHDLQVRYSTPWDGTISVGANNVFEHYATQWYGGANSQWMYYSGFDYGRYYYVRYQQRF